LFFIIVNRRRRKNIHYYLNCDILDADGDYQITTRSKAQIRYDGIVKWNPPMIYKSYCSIDIEYYPFDRQNCTLKFGTWTYHVIETL
jgi:hypothetical protein